MKYPRFAKYVAIATLSFALLAAVACGGSLSQPSGSDGAHNAQTTSQPAAGEFAQIYRDLAKVDPEILSIHISSGLSGTLDSARAGAAMVPEAKVTFWDTKTLSCPEAWQVEAALHPGTTVGVYLCSKARRLSAARRLSVSASRTSAARTSCTLRQVSSTSDEVMPWCRKRASGPTISAR